MQKFKQIIRYIVPVLSYLFLTGLFFSAGYLIGVRNTDEIMTVNPKVSATEKPTEQITPSPAAVKKHYRVILEDGQLRLYSDEDEKSRLISTDTISETAYPTGDIAKLKEGVVFDILSDALSFIENFLS